MTDQQDHATDLISLYVMREQWIACLQTTLGDPEAKLAQAHAEAKLAQVEEKIREMTRGQGDT